MSDQNKKRLCSICARGGSKGVPNKNIKEVAGIPLIAHSIEQAKKSGLFLKIAVNSDSDEILEIAKKSGLPFHVIVQAANDLFNLILLAITLIAKAKKITDKRPIR